MTEGRAFCHGAATIVNGIATGKGASFGIGLRTDARVEITDDPGTFQVRIENDPAEDPNLARYCVESVLDMFGLKGKHGARISTSSDIPISRGLKSSSTAANAVTLATFHALGMEYKDRDVIALGIEASFKAGVTLTGAYDDACAAYFGGVVVTDNSKMEIVKMYQPERDMEVIIHVPNRKIRKSTVETGRLRSVAPAIESAYRLAFEGDFTTGLLINGLCYGVAMGLDLDATVKALRNGAITAGITGTGPATVILASPDMVDRIVGSFAKDQIIRTHFNRTKAGPSD